MLSSLKKWVQDVAVDLAPPSTTSSSSPMPGSTHHYYYSTTPVNDQQESRKSSSSVVCLSRPISLESVRSSRTNTVSIPPPPPLVSPVELDLSHLNREEQEHIANVLKRARAVEEQSTLPSVTVPPRLSPPAYISPSSSSSSSSSSTSSSSYTNEQQQLEKYHNKISDVAEKSIQQLSESTLTTIHLCQICGREHRENSSTCFQCQENQSIDRDIEINNTFTSFSNQQLSPIFNTDNNHELEEEEEAEEGDDDDKIYDNIRTIDQEQENSIDINDNKTKLINNDIYRTNNLTEIDENEFFYEEPSPYILANKIEDDIISSYKIDELNEDDDNEDETDHVKELEQTIANLSRHFPSEHSQMDSSTKLPITQIDTDAILEMEIESPSADECSFNPPTHPLSLSISVPTPINNHRGSSIGRSSGIRENLTDLLIPTTSKPHQSLQRALSIHSKHMSTINRHKRNLPSVPNSKCLQLRRANSESRFNLPAVPFLQQNLDDECDLLEIDLNDPIGSMNRTLRINKNFELKFSNSNNNIYENHSYQTLSSNGKQIRDQTTNTPPISSLNSSIKSKKKVKKKNSSPSNNTNEQTISSPVVKKLQKSTSTEITYPFPVTKLHLTPSRHGITTDLGFRITGGHSISDCMEVTARIENIDTKHRNYEILKNIVQEGDEVLELGGVSLRGKSALFVENLINTIQNEFEIIVRNQLTDINSHSFLTTTDTNIPRRHSIDPSQLSSSNQPVNNTVTKSKSTSIYSLHQSSTNGKKEQSLPITTTKTLTSNDESTNAYSHRQRASLLPNDPGLNGAGNKQNIDRENSNESDESDSLSQYFQSSQSRTSSLTTTGNTSISHGRSQSVIPLANESLNASNRLQTFLKSSDSKRPSRGSTSMERKPSLSFASLKFLKKKTKSVDFSQQKNYLINQLNENNYVGDIELQISHDSEREQLIVRIIRAKNLLPKDTNGFSDPFVKIYLLPGRDQENKRRIKHLSKTLNPVWDQTVIYGHMHREELQYKKLELTVWDYDRFKKNDFLGQVTIDLKTPNRVDGKPQWYRLQSSRSREEAANRGSSPRLFKLPSADSAASSTLTINKNSVNMQQRINQQK